MPTDRFFINYQNGICKRQVIGKNKFSGTPKAIATALKLLEPERFTGHSFRRTSATLVANSEPNITILMQHGGWASPGVARSYCDSSLQTKERIFQHIVSENEPNVTGIETSHHEGNPQANIPPAKNNSSSNTSTSSRTNSPSAPTITVDSSSHDSNWGNDADNQLLESFDSIFLPVPTSKTSSPSAENSNPGPSHSRQPLASVENVQKSSPFSAPSNSNNSSLKRPIASLGNLPVNQPPKQQRQSQPQGASTRREETNNTSTGSRVLNNPALTMNNCTINNLTVNNYYSEPKNGTATNSEF